MWVLESTNDDTSYTLLVPAGSARTVGRSPRADFVVNAALVSRVHCRLSTSASGLHVEDLRSTNGTFVNGQRVLRSVLQVGDCLQLGRLEFTVSQK